ncbi:hypothetical protein J2Y55_001516 [Bosea sp. BE125]|uniref:hypothetical protein n=1 Tax=Bosea sp. BE125 TaxID=2817909 RepID=UPI00285C049E|nr:hypothetical protein [Bosea sp. BE125]MDR6870516.1 hypothetical protein [Bosea sp. BE125]
MIHESAPWKRHLQLDADVIERWASRPQQSERRSFLVERKVFLAAYAMRKLDDAVKISTDLLAADIAVVRFPPTAPGFTQFNNHKFDTHFDLGSPEAMGLPCRRLLNLLVHSLVFVEVLGQAETYDAFMVTSDQDRAKGLIQVEIATFVRVMRLVAADFPSDAKYVRDGKGGGMRAWAGHGEPLPGATWLRRGGR